jgi:hypothetical protein
MSDDVSNNPDLLESAPKLWTPAPALRGRVLLGAIAALVFAGLSSAASLTQIKQGPTPGGVTLALILDWVSLLPLAFVFWTYQGIGRGVDSAGLRKSAGCVFGTVLLAKVLLLTLEDVLPDGWDAVAWVVTGIGLIALVAYAFSSSRSTTTSSAPASKGSKAGWGSMALALVFLLKVGLKFLLVAGIKAGFWEILILLGLVLSMIGFVIWFAACKIRLREKLGGLFAFVGVAEIFAVLGACVFVVCLVQAYLEASAGVDFDEKAQMQFEEEWNRNLAVTTIVISSAWSTLTGLFLLALWNRRDYEDEWQRDLERAESLKSI